MIKILIMIKIMIMIRFIELLMKKYNQLIFSNPITNLNNLKLISKYRLYKNIWNKFKHKKNNKKMLENLVFRDNKIINKR